MLQIFIFNFWATYRYPWVNFVTRVVPISLRVPNSYISAVEFSYLYPHPLGMKPMDIYALPLTQDRQKKKHNICTYETSKYKCTEHKELHQSILPKSTYILFICPDQLSPGKQVEANKRALKYRSTMS
jgi:hypothetical protein